MTDATGCGGRDFGANAIELASGGFFDVIEPDAAAIDIYDIAHSLGMQTRFTGHCRVFYSVAQHSVLVSHAIDERYALYGLLHDASEAYLGDLSRPAKISSELSQYKAVENRIQAAVWRAFGLPPSEKCLAAVKKADNDLLFTEAHLLMLRGATWNWGPDVTPAELPSPLRLESLNDCWDWRVARDRFLDRFRELVE